MSWILYNYLNNVVSLTYLDRDIAGGSNKTLQKNELISGPQKGNFK